MLAATILHGHRFHEYDLKGRHAEDALGMPVHVLSQIGSSNCAGTDNQPCMQELADLLAGEVDMCRQLLDIEPDRTRCKWPLLTLARLQELQQQMGEPHTSKEETAAVYRELIEVDPLRKGYYEDVLLGNAKVMTFPFVPS